MLSFALMTGESLVIGKGAIIGMLFMCWVIVTFIFFLKKSQRHSDSQSLANLSKFDNHTAKNSALAEEMVHHYILTTFSQVITEFRPNCKFSVADVYYKLGKRYPRTLVKKVLLLLVDEGVLEECDTRKGTCFIRSKH